MATPRKRVRSSSRLEPFADDSDGGPSSPSKHHSHTATSEHTPRTAKRLRSASTTDATLTTTPQGTHGHPRSPPSSRGTQRVLFGPTLLHDASAGASDRGARRGRATSLSESPMKTGPSTWAVAQAAAKRKRTSSMSDAYVTEPLTRVRRTSGPAVDAARSRRSDRPAQEDPAAHPERSPVGRRARTASHVDDVDMDVQTPVRRTRASSRVEDLQLPPALLPLPVHLEAMRPGRATNINHLPDDVLRIVLGYVCQTPRPFAAVAAVCRRWDGLLATTSAIWRRIEFFESSKLCGGQFGEPIRVMRAGIKWKFGRPSRTGDWFVANRAFLERASDFGNWEASVLLFMHLWRAHVTSDAALTTVERALATRGFGHEEAALHAQAARTAAAATRRVSHPRRSSAASGFSSTSPARTRARPSPFSLAPAVRPDVLCDHGALLSSTSELALWLRTAVRNSFEVFSQMCHANASVSEGLALHAQHNLRRTRGALETMDALFDANVGVTVRGVCSLLAAMGPTAPRFVLLCLHHVTGEYERNLPDLFKDERERMNLAAGAATHARGGDHLLASHASYLRLLFDDIAAAWKTAVERLAQLPLGTSGGPLTPAESHAVCARLNRLSRFSLFSTPGAEGAAADSGDEAGGGDEGARGGDASLLPADAELRRRIGIAQPGRTVFRAVARYLSGANGTTPPSSAGGSSCTTPTLDARTTSPRSRFPART